jgi:hypothetical protein
MSGVMRVAPSGDQVGGHGHARAGADRLPGLEQRDERLLVLAQRGDQLAIGQRVSYFMGAAQLAARAAMRAGDELDLYGRGA